MSVIYAFMIEYKDIQLPFSDSKNAARFIIRHHLDDRDIVAFRSENTSALLPYLPHIKFWYPEIEDYGTFVTWDKKHFNGKDISNLELLAQIKERFPPGDSDVILILSYYMPLDRPSLKRYWLLYETKKKVFWYGGEKYYIYKRKQG